MSEAHMHAYEFDELCQNCRALLLNCVMLNDVIVYFCHTL